MANRNRRAVRAAEEETFDILAEVLTPEEQGKLLRTPLESAARQGNKKLARKLAGAGAKMGVALNTAARGVHEEIVNDLLENGASVATKDTRGCTPLYAGAREVTTEIVPLLLLKGADEDALYGLEWTPHYRAASRVKVGAALSLLAAGADVNLRYNLKESVLHAAVERCTVDIMRASIERGANVDDVGIRRRTPLHLAALFDKAGAIGVLVEAGADIEARDGAGRTPLHRAADEYGIDALLALSKHGADANAQDNDQHTPLHHATSSAGEQGDAEMIDSLLRAGADETILNDEGQTAVDMIDWQVSEDDQMEEDIDHVLRLLANAPADRAWRRRGYLVMCRAHPDRVQQMQLISGAKAVVVQTTGNGAKESQKAKGNGCIGPGKGSLKAERGGGDWAVVVARVLGLQEEGIFRTIVGYL